MKASLCWEKIQWASNIIYSHDGSFSPAYESDTDVDII